MRIKKLSILPICGLIFFSCTDNTEDVIRQKTNNYFTAWNNHDFVHPDFQEFKRDTSYTWHDAKVGQGIESIFNPNSGWKQWDVAWNGIYQYEILEIDTDSMKVTGDFIETNDFLKYIGMPEGFSATVTYWFDEELKVKETLYDWSEDNRSLHDLIKPVVDWAKENDSIRIQRIYLENGFVPSKENADEWKELFQLYETARQ